MTLFSVPAMKGGGGGGGGLGGTVCTVVVGNKGGKPRIGCRSGNWGRGWKCIPSTILTSPVRHK